MSLPSSCMPPRPTLTFRKRHPYWFWGLVNYLIAGLLLEAFCLIMGWIGAPVPTVARFLVGILTFAWAYVGAERMARYDAEQLWTRLYPVAHLEREWERADNAVKRAEAERAEIGWRLGEARRERQSHD